MRFTTYSHLKLETMNTRPLPPLPPPPGAPPAVPAPDVGVGLASTPFAPTLTRPCAGAVPAGCEEGSEVARGLRNLLRDTVGAMAYCASGCTESTKHAQFGPCAPGRRDVSCSRPHDEPASWVPLLSRPLSYGRHSAAALPRPCACDCRPTAVAPRPHCNSPALRNIRARNLVAEAVIVRHQ